MSAQFVNGRPVFQHKIEYRQTEATPVKTNEFSTRWEAVSYAVKLIKEGYVHVVPLSWVKGEDGATGTFQPDEKSQKDIGTRLEGKATPVAGGFKLSTEQEAMMKEAASKLIAYSKIGTTSGLAQEHMADIMFTMFATLKDLGYTQDAVRHGFRETYQPKVEQPAQ